MGRWRPSMGEIDEARATMRLALIRAGLAPEPIVPQVQAAPIDGQEPVQVPHVDMGAQARVEEEIEEVVIMYWNTPLDRILSNCNMLKTVRNLYL
jgi:hypothetical protein